VSFTVKIAKHSNGVICFSLNGKIISSEGFGEVTDNLDLSFQEGYKKLIIDMSQVSYINSSGLNLLVRLLTKVRNKSGELVLIALSESVEKLFFITKLNSIFTICADVSEAQNIFNAQEA